MALMPKRIKHRKVHRGHLRGLATRAAAAVRSAGRALGRSVVRLLAHGHVDRVLGRAALVTGLIALMGLT